MRGHFLSPKNCPLACGDLDPHKIHHNTWFIGPTRVHTLNGISIGSAVFAGLPNMDGSIVCARWLQCAPHVTRVSLGPPDSTTRQHFDQFSHFWATVCKTVRLTLSDLCHVLSVCAVLSVCDVGVLWPNGWMYQNTTWHRCSPLPRRHCVRWGRSFF